MADDDARDDARDDPRDKGMGARLEVAPLDDVTKRQLVSTAMRKSKPAPTARWIAAAAAVVLVVAGGVVLLVAPGSQDDRPAATPARAPAGASGPAAADRSKAAPSEASSSAVGRGEPVDVGDFGDLSHTANLARLRRAVASAALVAPAAPTPKAANDRGVALMAELATRPCRVSLPAGTITAVGTGTLDHRPTIVVLTTAAGGETTLDAVLGDPCTVRPLP